MITVGIDEVGRGCWAGPLVAGAVILPSPSIVRKVLADQTIVLRDSKNMTRKQREKAAAWIMQYASAVGIGWVWPAEIDEVGITASVRLAMERALANVEEKYDDIIIDGNINYLADNKAARAIVKADDSVRAVSAASIAAKVARDTYMIELDRTYPSYGFASNVGYGTAVHIAALKTHGATDVHRRSYKPIIRLQK